MQVEVENYEKHRYEGGRNFVGGIDNRKYYHASLINNTS